MKIVTISGASKDVGKTNLAVSIIKKCQGLAALKYSFHYPQKEAGVITDSEILTRPGTDTARFLEAGASPVFWVLSDEKRLGLDLKRALSLLSPDSKVIIEGNSVLKHLRPIFAIFVMNSSWEKVKPSGLEVISRADVVVEWNNDGHIREKIVDLNPSARLLDINPHKPEGEDFKLLLQDLQNIMEGEYGRKDTRSGKRSS